MQLPLLDEEEQPPPPDVPPPDAAYIDADIQEAVVLQRRRAHEVEVICSMLGMPREYVWACEIIHASDFVNSPNRKAFAAVVDLSVLHKKPVTLGDLRAELERRHELFIVGGDEYLATLVTK